MPLKALKALIGGLMALTYYFILTEEKLSRHGDDLQEEGAYSSAREARNVILSRGYWADNASLTRYKNLQDEYLYLAEREFDPYEQRWTS